MATRKDDRSTLERIEEAAILEFAESGYHGARIDRIAKRGKINKAMIYYHFKGKEALYEHTLYAIVSEIYRNIEPLIPKEEITRESLQELIRGYSGYLAGIDRNRIRIMLREISTGGKYFKKITIPNLVEPVVSLFISMFQKGKSENIVKDLDPLFTMLSVIGSIIFFNIMRITISDSTFGEKVFRDDPVKRYTENLIRMYEDGIFREENV
jgi:TetR/AcrR family transcriptional regulator